MSHSLPSAVLAVANAQDGLITHAQAVAGGLHSSQVSHLVASARWSRPARGVLATFTGELTDRQRAWRAVLAAGRDAALAAESAAWAHGLVPALTRPVSVAVPDVRRPASSDDLRVVRTRGPRRSSGSPPRSSIEDLVCDLAGRWAGDRLAGIVADVVRERRTTPARLERTIGRRGRFTGAAALRDLVADVGAGAESPLELRYLHDVERRHRLPRGTRQDPDHADGRDVVRDVVYEEFALVVELDGTPGHAGLRSRFADLGRDLSTAASGRLTLRYVWRDVAGSPCVVAGQVAAMLAAGGWTGRARRCGPSCGV